MFLTEKELRDMTKKIRPSLQKRELDHLGIPCKVRLDGTLIVLRAHVEFLPQEPPKRQPQVRMA